MAISERQEAEGPAGQEMTPVSRVNVTLPDFIGIGAQRAGTSWLDQNLRSHPDIHLPGRRKEIHFFDQYWDRGVAWYERFFSGAEGGRPGLAIGEITPRYLFDPLVPERIHSLLPSVKLLAILRNPVDRAYSQYGLSVWLHAEKRSFETFLEEKDDVFARGLYAEQLKRYLKVFRPEQVLVLVFEEVMREPERALDRIAGFLGVDPAGFTPADRKRRVNNSRRPRFPTAMNLLRSAGSWLRRMDLDLVTNLGKRMVPLRLLGDAGSIPPMAPETRSQLIRRYEPDVRELETMMGLELASWRS